MLRIMGAVLYDLSNLIRKVLGGDKECLPVPHLSSQKLYSVSDLKRLLAI
jgi:hypothetical protein